MGLISKEIVKADDVRLPEMVWGLMGLYNGAARINDVQLRTHVQSNLVGMINSFNVEEELLRRGYATKDELKRYGLDEYKEPSLFVPGKAYVGYVGRIRCGKGRAGKLTEGQYSGRHFEFVRSLMAFALATLDDPDGDRAALRRVNDKIKPKFGNDTFARETFYRAARLCGPDTDIKIISTDGYRSTEEANLLLSIPGSALISVNAEIETRYGRARQADLVDKPGQAPKSFSQFKYDDNFEYEHMQKHAMALSTHEVDNNGDIRELDDNLRPILLKLINGQGL